MNIIGFSKGISNRAGQKSRILGPWLALLIGLATTVAKSQPASAASENSLPQTAKESLWQGNVGEGFRPTVQDVTLEAGAAAGLATFGSRQAHDLALLSLSYGHMLGHVIATNHWYRGNWELRGELFGGAQFSPSSEWLVGLTPHLRYNLATGTRWVPFIDGGAGVTATSIGEPDLSNTFEFNLQ